MKSTCYMLIGLPASGKTTFCNQLWKNTNSLIISPDSIRKMLLNSSLSGVYFKQEIESIVWISIIELLNSTCQLQKNIIYDATNISIKSRENILLILKKYNYEIIGIYLDTSLESIYERDKIRQEKVGKDVINRMVASFQLPTLDEGFTKIVTSDYFDFD